MTADRLAALAVAWNRRWMAGAVAAAVAAGLATATALLRLADLPAAPAALGGAIMAAALAAATWRRRPGLAARDVARHLDRAIPALEDSAELVLAGDAELEPLARLQRQRVLQTLAATPEPTLPQRPLRRALRAAGVLLAATVALATIPLPRPGVTRQPTPAQASRAAPVVVEVEVGITPPAYTARRPRRVFDWDLSDIEEGARVTWRIALDGATGAALVTSGGDSLPLRPDGAGRVTATLTPRATTLYQVIAWGPGGRTTTEFHRLLVLPDAAPTVTIVRPELRTTLPQDTTPRVALEALANDDYGLATAEIVATLTSGRGEGVKFREQRLAFDSRAARPGGGGGGWLLRRTLDLAALGLRPGDELYFYVTARDRRSPEANETRSETHFVAIADTAAGVAADFSGLALDVLPEYFRSQRQIIIDTERLLADRPRIAQRAFRDRSQNIGLDQHLLRLRYGEIVGDETVADAALEVDATGAPEAHEHDTEENATRLGRTVKETLKAALAEMWEAELRLRTYQPAAALPYEYRALELLKQVQQAARVYVQRTGFEPAPLEPDRNRLTGKLDGIASRSSQRQRPPADTLPAVRAALAALDAGPHAAVLVPVLETAGREVARLAADDPVRHLEALAILRTLIRSLESDGAACAGCVARASRALRGTLPEPARAPAGGAPAGGVARRYFELLEGRP